MVKNKISKTQTPQQFFNKNMKWIALTFGCFLLLSLVKGCNRNMATRATEKEYTDTIDSLEKKIDILKEENKQLAFELKFESERANEAQRRAEAIQSVAEKIKSNTTVNVRGAEVDNLKK